MSVVAALAREKIFITARNLPAAPQVLARLGELLQDVNTGLDQIAALLKRDAALVARIIRISNSAFYAGDGQIGAIEEAVKCVGFGEIYRLAGVATTSRLVDRALVYYRVDAEPLREHMLYTALASEALAEKCGLDGRCAYTAGLLRGLGMLVLDRVAREFLPPESIYDHKHYDHYGSWEGDVFSLGNCEVAALILNEWRFPADIVGAVREHYLLRETDYESHLACLLNLAGWLTTQEKFGLQGERAFWKLTPRKLNCLGLDEAQVRQLGVRVRNEFERLRRAL
jgi:HD-like signal output (HDOD) protein